LGDINQSSFGESMFKNAIVRTPSRSMVKGITSANLGVPNYDKALEQHQAYIRALELAGLEVTILEPLEDFPDSTFVEDTALLTPSCAIITRPGADSRRAEVAEIESAVKQFYPNNTFYIEAPATVEAGDIMMVGQHFYIGLSERTNQEGVEQMLAILNQHGQDGQAVEMQEFLHLKTGVNYLEKNNILVAGEFVTHKEFADFNHIVVDEDEAYAANSLWVNGKVIVPSGYPKVQQQIEALGYEVLNVDVSEFKKLDGGLSCLSLRF
jgi:dimethylargininase